MTFESCYNRAPAILMEGALGERLKREYGLTYEETVAMAGFIYEEKSRAALKNLWNEYISAAARFGFRLSQQHRPAGQTGNGSLLQGTTKRSFGIIWNS